MHGTPLQSRNFYEKPLGLLARFTRSVLRNRRAAAHRCARDKDWCAAE